MPVVLTLSGEASAAAQLRLTFEGQARARLLVSTSSEAASTQVLQSSDLQNWTLLESIEGPDVQHTIDLPVSEPAQYFSAQTTTAELAGNLGNLWCLGDSWTDCFEEVTWRRVLWQRLINEGWTVDFVGTHRDPASCESGQDYDRDHQGTSGVTAEETLHEIDRLLRSVAPDTVLLMLGGNDIDEGGSNGLVVVDRLSSIIDRIRSVNPRVVIHLGVYGYVDVSVTDGQLDGFAALASDLAAEKTSTMSPVWLVDHRLGWDKTTDLADDRFHPSPRGMTKIAENWLESIRRSRPNAAARPLDHEN